MFERFRRNRASDDVGTERRDDVGTERRDDVGTERRDATSAPRTTEATGPRTGGAPVREDAEAVQYREFGGVNWGAAFFGWLVAVGLATRSEERRVGKECRSRWSPYH